MITHCMVFETVVVFTDDKTTCENYGFTSAPESEEGISNSSILFFILLCDSVAICIEKTVLFISDVDLCTK